MLHAETDTAPVESAWVELRARLDLNDDFWLGFVWAPVTSWLDRLERYTTDYLLGHGKQIEKNLGPHAGRPANASKVLADLDAKAPLLWIRWEPAHDPQLAAATPTFHEFFNRSRDILRRTRPGGIVLAGHHDGRVPFRNACPDLWSYRSLDVEQAISRLPVTPTIVDVNLSFDVDEMILKSQRLKGPLSADFASALRNDLTEAQATASSALEQAWDDLQQFRAVRHSNRQAARGLISGLLESGLPDRELVKFLDEAAELASARRNRCCEPSCFRLILK